MTSGPCGLAPGSTRSPKVHPPEFPIPDPGRQDAEDTIVQDVGVRAVCQVDGGRDQEPQAPEVGGEPGAA
eukprot:868917-Pyramimonas_sp.AAC.1